ncbi:hypothetical protein [Synechococcus sp. RS9907]
MQALPLEPLESLAKALLDF